MEKNKNVEVNELLGKHYLSGVDFGEIKIDSSFNDTANTINFILDNEIFTVVEDPSDGYRSRMEEIFKNKNGVEVKNTFCPVEVFVVERDENDCDIFDFYDVGSNKIILSIGTEYTDEYYPYFVSEWNPENLAINIL
jgi:hypothetical protein